MKWRDATSYNSRYPEGSRFNPTEANAWEIEADGVRVYITRVHRFWPGGWAMHCYDIGHDAVGLGLSLTKDTPVEVAQEAALAKVNARVREIAAALEKMGETA